MFGKDESPETHLKKKFWKDLQDDRTVMLGLKGVEDDLTRPMTAQVDVPQDGDKEEGGPIYFFASKTDGIGQDLKDGVRAIATFASKSHGLFASIHGTLHASSDRGVIERLWNPIIDSWYKDGKDDPDLRLIKFEAESADIWEADAGATLKAAALKWAFNIDPGKDHQKENRTEVKL
ncbi:MAG TPA: pyridoxamine 5'-phosphate oxidase family protein [Sphingomicrobium sp.]|nr:pyridoxamine 5'-phosphate oxidase family protein [Sphingomicrobium sp.]